MSSVSFINTEGIYYEHAENSSEILDNVFFNLKMEKSQVVQKNGISLNIFMKY